MPAVSNTSIIFAFRPPRLPTIIDLEFCRILNVEIMSWSPLLWIYIYLNYVHKFIARVWNPDLLCDDPNSPKYSSNDSGFCVLIKYMYDVCSFACNPVVESRSPLHWFGCSQLSYHLFSILNYQRFGILWTNEISVWYLLFCMYPSRWIPFFSAMIRLLPTVISFISNSLMYQYIRLEFIFRSPQL